MSAVLRWFLIFPVWLLLSSCAGVDAPELREAEQSVYRIIAKVSEKNKNSKGRDEIVENYSVATGFLVSGINVVATNAHVVENAVKDKSGNALIYVMYRENGKIEYTTASVEKFVPVNGKGADLAILKANRALPGKPLKLADFAFSQLEDGSEVKAIGYPVAADFGSDIAKVDLTKNPGMMIATKTDGRISRTIRFDGVETVQHQAPISPGNSGGPLFDSCNTVIGINAFRGKEYGIGGAIYSGELVRALKLLGSPINTHSERCNAAMYAKYTTPAIAIGAVLLSFMALMLALRQPRLRSALSGMTRVRAPMPVMAPMGTSGGMGQQRPTTGVPMSPPQQRPTTGAPPGTVADTRSAAPYPDRHSSAPTRMLTEVQSTMKLVPVAGGSALGLDGAKLAGRGIIVGRNDSCDLVIADSAVSNRHACLTTDGAGQLKVEDLHSGNGTWQGTKRITNAVFRDGETIKFGSVAYRVDLGGTGASSQRSSGAARANGTSRPEWRLTGQDGKGVGVELLFQPKLDEASGELLATDWVIGRSRESADRVVSDASVSGVHARMRYAPGRGLEICDAGSSNGTKLDGKPVSTSFVPLDGARVVQLGTLKLQVNTRT